MDIIPQFAVLLTYILAYIRKVFSLGGCRPDLLWVGNTQTIPSQGGQTASLWGVRLGYRIHRFKERRLFRKNPPSATQLVRSELTVALYRATRLWSPSPLTASLATLARP